MEFNFSTIDLSSLSTLTKSMEHFNEEFGIPLLMVDSISTPSFVPSSSIIPPTSTSSPIPGNQWDMAFPCVSPCFSPLPSPIPSPYSSPVISPCSSPSQDELSENNNNVNNKNLNVNKANTTRLSPTSHLKRKDCTVEFRKQFISLLHKDRKARLEWKEFHKQSECAKKRNCIKLMQLFCEKYGSKFAELSSNKNYRALGTRSKCLCNESHPSLLPSPVYSLFPIPPTQSYATPSQYCPFPNNEQSQMFTAYTQTNTQQFYPSQSSTPSLTQIPYNQIPCVFPPAGYPAM